jgi:hypothetical protein
MVHTDAQNLGIQSLELGLFSFVRWDLVRSYRRPGQREESKHDISPPQTAQGHLRPQVAGQVKIRRALTDFNFHSHMILYHCQITPAKAQGGYNPK